MDGLYLERIDGVAASASSVGAAAAAAVVFVSDAGWVAERVCELHAA